MRKLNIKFCLHLCVLCFILSFVPFFFLTFGRANVADSLPDDLIALESPIFDFGVQPQGERLKHVFTLLNNTRSAVKIIEYRTSCTCVVAGEEEPRNLTIAPGARFQVPLSFTTGNEQSRASGRALVYYRKEGSDSAGEIGQLALVVRAEVTPDYRLLPEIIDFGVVDGLSVSEPKRVFEVTPAANVDLKITDIRASSDRVSGRLLPEKRHQSYLVEVALHTSALVASRAVSERIILSTNSKRSPSSIVEVRARYKAAIEADPTSLIIDSSEQGEVDREIRIVTACPARIISVSSADPTKVRPSMDLDRVDGDFVCQVKVAASEGGPINSQLHVTLELQPDDSHSVTRTLAIPVYRF